MGKNRLPNPNEQRRDMTVPGKSVDKPRAAGLDLLYAVRDKPVMGGWGLTSQETRRTLIKIWATRP